MTFLRLILLVLLGLLLRQWVHRWRLAAGRTQGRPRQAEPDKRQPADRGAFTDQDISDADFEEIP